MWTITTTTGKQYSIDNKQFNWIKNRYQQQMADTYGLDDADQLAKRNGQLSASALKTYKNSNVDRKLAELGLPSEKNLEKYLESYNQWHTGGMDQYFGQANLPKDYWTKAKGWYRSDMQNAYENTAEDQQRKARGLMPSKWEAKYTDTEIDDELRARGLPPISEFNTYRDRWNNYQGIENFYANVALADTNLRLQGINDDDKEYSIKDPQTGEVIKTGIGKDLYAESFYNELKKKNDDGSFVYGNIIPMFQNRAKPSSATPSGDYAYDLGAEIVAANKEAASDKDYANYNAFSYDDYKKHYDDLYNRYFANQKTNSGQLVSDAMAVKQMEADEAATKAYYTVGKTNADAKAFATKYLTDHPTTTVEEMLTDMAKHNVPDTEAHNVYWFLKDLAAQSGLNDTFNDVVNAWIHTYGGEWSNVSDSYAPIPDVAKPLTDEQRDAQREKDMVDAAMKYADSISFDKDNLFNASERIKFLGFNNVEDMAKALKEGKSDQYKNAVKEALSLYNYAMEMDPGTADEQIRLATAELNALGFDGDNAVTDATAYVGGASKADPASFVNESTDLMIANRKAKKEAYANDTEAIDATRAEIESQLFGDVGAPLSAKEVREVVMEYDNALVSDDRAGLYDATQKLRALGIVNREAADEWLRTHNDHDATEAVNPNNLDVDGVIQILDAVKKDSNPVAFELALKDLGFNDGDYSGAADDLTYGWSDADKRKLAFYLGGGKLSDRTYDEVIPGFNRAEGDTIGDTWADAGVAQDKQKLNPTDFSIDLEWVLQQVNAGKMTEEEGYNLLAANGYQNEMEYYMPEEWHKAHFIENTAPGLWNQSREEDLLLWEEMTPEQQREASTAMWDRLTDEQKASMYRENWWEYDPSVYRTFGQSLEQQIRGILPGFITELAKTPVTVADSIGAQLSGRPQLWDVTQKLIDLQNGISQLGSVSDNVNGAKVAAMATDAVQELLRMEVYGAVGIGIGESAFGGALTKVAGATSSKSVKKAASLFLGMARSSPFMISSYASNYADWKVRGASNGEAAWNALKLALVEGALEEANFDGLWGQLLGQKSFASQLVNGADNYLGRLGIIGKSWIANASVSGLGELTEESIGYVYETYLKRKHSDTWGEVEWSADEWFDQAIMGFITGVLGGAVNSVGSFVYDGVALSKALRDNPQLRQQLPDVLASVGVAGSIPEPVLETYRKGGAEVMSNENYGNIIDQVSDDYTAIFNAANLLDKTKAEAKAEYDTKVNEINATVSSAVAANVNDSGNLGEFVKKCKKLGISIDFDSIWSSDPQTWAAQIQAKAQAAKQNALDNARAEYETAVAKAEADYEGNVKQKQRLLDNNRKKIQEHYVGLYLQNEGLLNSLSEDMLTNLAQAYQNGAKYEPGQQAELVRKGVANEQRAETAKAEETTATAEALEPVAAEAENAPAVPLTDSEQSQVKDISKRIGFKGEVSFVNDPEQVFDGKIEDGNITLNLAYISASDAKELRENPGFWVLKHEFTHFIEGENSYKDFFSAVKSQMVRELGEDGYAKAVQAYKDAADKAGHPFGNDIQVERDMVADYVGSQLFTSQDAIDSFVREQEGAASRVFNWLRYVINRGKLRRSKDASALKILEAERMYSQAFRKANKKPAKDSDTNYSTPGISYDMVKANYGRNEAGEYVGVANPRTGVTAEEDAEYMRAALAGDTETTGRMVRDMYERNGLMHVYRGEPQATGSWTEVDMDKFKGPGMFAATDIDTARASEYTQSYAREDLKTKPLSYGDAMPVLQQFADGVAQRIGRGTSLVADSYYMDDEGNEYAEDGLGREHHWALRNGDTGEIFADSTELAKLADAAKRKAARIIGGNPQNIYNSINDPFAGRVLDLFVKFDNANEHNANGDEWDQIQLNAPKGVTLYRIEVTNDPENESSTTITAYPIDESFDAESSSASERGTKTITFEPEDDMDYMYKLEQSFKDLFGKKSDISDFFIENAEWGEDGATLEKVGIYDKNGRTVRPEDFPDAETTSTDELAARDKEAGYDGSIIRNVRDGGPRATTDTVSFNPNYIKSADAITYDNDGNVIPLSQRGDFARNELRYSTPGLSWEEMLRQYGAIEPGRNPRARDVQVPKQTNDNNRVSQWIRSLIESGKLTDDQAQNVLRMVVEQDYGTYVPTSQAERMEEARAYIAERQPLQAQQEFHDMVMQGKFGVKTNALGIQLLSDASARGDIASVLDIASDLQLAATEAGQSAQIFNVLKELKGVGSAWYMQKVIDRMNAKYADRIKAGKMNRIAVDPALMAELAKATTVDQMAAAEEAVAKDIARQLPLTWDDRLSSWRYFSMLANPTTHIRNITGNLLMKGLNTAKDAVATGLENLLGVDQGDRAHAILSQADRNTWRDWVQQSYEEQARNLSGGSKLGFESFVKQNMRSFDNKFVNALAQFNFKALENEDIAFIKPAYKNALMQYMVAQGYTLNEKGQAGKVDAKGQFREMTKAQMNEAIDWASQQAWKQTFRDASSLATMLNKLSKENAVSRLLVEGVMPFKKTPINIARRGVDYSPAGIIKGIAQLTNGVKKGKVTTAQAIDTLSSGITGSALMALGVMLAKLGVIRAGGEKDKKLETFLEDTGDQTYAMKFGDKSINMSSIAPATIPLFMGVALNEMIEQGGDTLDLSTITDTIAGTLNPFMEMSFMSSLNSALKNYNANGIGGALGSTLMTAAQNYGSQYLPTLGGKIAQFIDPTRRTTKSDITSPVGSNMDYYARSLAKKVPGLESTLQPDVDVWGRTDKKDTFGEWAWDFANKFILPTNIKVTNRDAVDNELIRVVESTGVTDFLPSDGAKYFTVNKVKYEMNAKQYSQYSQDRGQAAYAALKDVMAGASYQRASDEEKAAMLKKALDAAYKQVSNQWKEKLGAYNK